MLKNFYANSSAAILIIFAVIVGGMVQFSRLPVALYPMTSKPKIVVYMNVPDMAPQEFYERYGKNAEEILQQIQDVDNVRAEYEESRISYEVTYDWGVEPEEAKATTIRSLAGVESRFPNHWQGFRYWFEGGEGALTIASITSPDKSPKELSEILNEGLVPRLRAIKDFSSVWIKRFDRKKVEVVFQPDLLTSTGVTPQQIATALQANRYNSSLGFVEYRSGESRQVILTERSRSLHDIKRTLVSNKNGRKIYLEDVAQVYIDDVLPDSFYKADGKNGLIVVAKTKPDANIAQASRTFQDLTQKTLTDLNLNADMNMMLDPSIFINGAVRNVIIAVIIGILAAGIVIFLFLGSFKNTLLIALSIPFSLLGGFILMSVLGIEVNLISLGAMALAAGMVVDGSIVVLENISRHMEMTPPKSYTERLAVVARSIAEVRSPVIASLLTTIIVFLPLSFTSPLAAAILGDLAKVIVCVLCVSVLATLLILPPMVVYLKLGGREDNTESSHFIFGVSLRFRRGFERAKALYLKWLEVFLTRQRPRRIFAAAVGAAFVGSVVLGGLFVKREIMGLPETDKVFLGVNYKDGDMELKQSEQIISHFEKQVRDEFGPYLSKTLTKIRKNGGWVLNYVKDKSKIDEFRQKLEDRFKNSPLISFWVFPWTPTQLEIPKPPLLSIDFIAGTDHERFETMEEILKIINQSRSVGRQRIFPLPDKSDLYELQFKENRLASSSGTGGIKSSVQKSDVVSHISQALQKIDIKDVSIDDKSVPVQLRYPEYYIKGAEGINNMILKSGDKYVPLRNYVQVQPTRKRSRFARENGRKLFQLEAWPRLSKQAQAKTLSQNLVQAIQQNPDIDKTKIRFNDTDREINQNISSLLNALVLALMLILILICIQFASFAQTLCIMLAVPLGIIGVGISLYLFSSVLSVNSMLGVILLSGTAVNNSIIFVDFYNHLRKQAGQVQDSAQLLLEVARLRFRPIMITTMTTILGMFPIALGFGEGGEILRPLGIAVCGGLGISTLLTLFVIPLMLHKMSQWKLLAPSMPNLAVGLLCLVGVMSAPDLQAQSLSDYEKAATTKYAQVQISRLETQQAKDKFRATLGNFLPRLSIGYQVDMLKQEPTLPEFKRRNEYGFLSVEYNLSSLIATISDSRAAKLEHKQAEWGLQNSLLELQSQVRKSYYTVVRAEHVLKNARESLTLAERYEADSSRRYRAGLLHVSQYERSRLLKVSLEVAVKKAVTDLSVAKEDLFYLTGKTWPAGAQSSQVIPENFSYFSQDLPALEAKSLAATNPRIEFLKLGVKAAQARQTGAGAQAFLPHAFSEFGYRKSRSEQATDSTQLSFGLRWPLFNGGKDYFSFRQRVSQKHITAERLRDALELRQQALRNLFYELSFLKRALQTQNDVVKSWKKIMETSQRRFKQGVVKSIQVDDDFKAYLQEIDRQLDLGLQIIHKLSELAVWNGDGTWFTRLKG